MKAKQYILTKTGALKKLDGKTGNEIRFYEIGTIANILGGGRMRKITLPVSFFIAIFYLLGMATFVHAADFTEEFSIHSPENVEKLEYMRWDPPFSITAPKDWYLALRREGAPPASVGAMFFKRNPEEKGRQGTLELPYFRVDFYWNDGISSAMDYSSATVEKLKELGLKIVTYPEKISVDGQTFVHYAASKTHAGGEEIHDTYIFVDKNKVIRISAVCPSDEYKEVNKEIHSAIETIKFSLY